MNVPNNPRMPFVAGQFYSADPQILKNEISSLLAQVSPPEESNAMAIIAPHAGYSYSGQIALKAFLSTRKKAPQRIILLAPSHRYALTSIATTNYDSFITPLGITSVDLPFLQKLHDQAPSLFTINNQAHQKEHSIEVQLPFLQTLHPHIPIVPLLFGPLSEEKMQQVAQQLLPYIGNENLWVISSDFTHFGAAFEYTPFHTDIPQSIEKLDMDAIRLITQGAPHDFFQYIQDTGITICGATPINTFLYLIDNSLIKPNIQLLEYSNSGKLTNDYTHCVSYASIAFSHIC